MKKVALVFVLAVFLPSLVLAWLAVRSLRDQQFVLERQQSLLYQSLADSVAKEAASLLAEHQREFARQVEAMLGENKATEVADSFDRRLRRDWRLADVGFAVSLDGQVYSPNVFDGTEAWRFRLENEKFLCSRESVQVYWNSPKGPINLSLADAICVALPADHGRPRAQPTLFETDWKHPFVATEIGEALPHWEVAVYLLNPARLSQSARTLKLTLGLLIAVLVLAIGVGGWLIVADLNRQLTLARQKTDFVSNVSHELKTPLTSIRMFSELLADGRVLEKEKQRSYLNIITAETARLTRLINNVLDFSRLERGEKKYNFAKCDLAGVVQETVETYRPHLEANGFKLEYAPPESPLSVNGDRDALAQIVVNLLSNVEKYSNDRKEVRVETRRQSQPLPHVEVRVLDRGFGVPQGCEEKIFEQFYRAHDSLSSGIQGSGLGLTLARQIARAHGGDVG